MKRSDDNFPSHIMGGCHFTCGSISWHAIAGGPSVRKVVVRRRIPMLGLWAHPSSFSHWVLNGPNFVTMCFRNIVFCVGFWLMFQSDGREKVTCDVSQFLWCFDCFFLLNQTVGISQNWAGLGWKLFETKF